MHRPLSHETTRQVNANPTGGPYHLGGHGFFGLLGDSPAMREVYRVILRMANKRHPVLILGESGTGKELVARAIHAQGPWRDKPFVPVDCGALAPTLFESELFGHVRGAFTGATEARQGLLASAQGGTLFLDEIAELPFEAQAKLLRVLQEYEVKPLGTNERRRVDARIVAATNQDLKAAIKRGTFRKDLYFRLNVVAVKLPPLRERAGDIPALVDFFIKKHGGAESGGAGLSDEVMRRLMSYDWPGNVRELENCIQRVLVVGSGPMIQVCDLPSSLLYFMASTPAARDDARTLQVLERHAILQALEATGGDRARAARLLGIGKTTIYRKVKQYGLERSVSIPSRQA